MFGPRRQLAIVHGPQFPAHRLGRDDDAVFLEHPLAEVDKPPAHDAMNARDRAILHHASQRRAVLRRQPRRLPRRLAGDEPRGTMSVELENPVPDDLKRHAADLRRFPPRRPVVNRRQRQKSTGLAPRPWTSWPRREAQLRQNRLEAGSASRTPWFATSNQIIPDSGIPPESGSMGAGIRPCASGEN